MTQEDWFGLGHVETITTRKKSTAEIRGAGAQQPQQQGYWEHGGKPGETRMSLHYSSERSQCALSRVQRSELASVLHVSEEEVRGESWKVRLGNKGTKPPL